MNRIKINYHGIDHLSIGSINAFRRNSLQWYLKYMKGFESKELPFSMIRGKAIETAIVTNLTCEVPTMINKKIMGVTSFLEQIYNHYRLDKSKPITPEFLEKYDYLKLEMAPRILSEPGLIGSLLTEEIPEWKAMVSPFDQVVLQEYHEKLEKELLFILDVLENEKFSETIIGKEQIQHQSRVETELKGVKLPLLGFIDIETESTVYEFKTTSTLPKTKDDISLDHLLQIAFYGNSRGKDTKLVYFSKTSEDSIKAEFILERWKKGMPDKEIIYEMKTLKGKGTTSEFISKVVESPEKYLKPSTKIFEFGLVELKKYNALVQKLAKSMVNLLSLSDKKILESCIRSYSEGFLDYPDDLRHEIYKLLF